MPIPHDFPSIVDRQNQVVLIIGTGLSTPNCPTLRELKTNLDSIANGIEVDILDNEYELAEKILDKLVENGKSDSESRLWLAEHLGMLDDKRWFAEVGLPLSGNTQRHRAIARFVVEGSLGGIVSLNWDALMEAALDSVGLTENENFRRPWKYTKYARVVDDKHLPKLAPENVFPVIKPHGCVRELVRMRKQIQLGNMPSPVIFMFKFAELEKLPDDQNTAVNSNVEVFITKFPLIGIGWRASEGYLRNTIIKTATKVNRPEPDSFTLIDRKWNQHHSEIATAYSKDMNEAFAQVSIGVNPSTDCLFQWLYARYALKLMITMMPDAEQPSLVQILQDIEQPKHDHPIQSWVDFWLPTWVRLCWRAGAMQGFSREDNTPIGPFEIPVVPRDAHIPLRGITNERRDLHAAAKLLCILYKKFHSFRFDNFPGGLLDIERRYLFIPLPGWKAAVPSSDLAALKPLVKGLRGLGYVKNIFLIWLNNQDEDVDERLQQQLEAQFRRLMPLTSFASGNTVSWIELEELGGI